MRAGLESIVDASRSFMPRRLIRRMISLNRRPRWSAASCGALSAGGSPEHAAGVQRYFSEPVRSHGWYTADLRRYARTLHKELASDPALLLDVAERLFAGAVLEEKALAVTMLEPSLKRLRRRRVRALRAMARQGELVGRPRCPHDVPHRPDDGGRAGAREAAAAVGGVAKPLAAPGGGRVADSRHPEGALLRRGDGRDRAARRRPRRHGAEGPGVAPARMGQVRPQAPPCRC